MGRKVLYPWITARKMQYLYQSILYTGCPENTIIWGFLGNMDNTVTKTIFEF